MDNEGNGREIQLRNLAANEPLSLCNWKNSMVSRYFGEACHPYIMEHETRHGIGDFSTYWLRCKNKKTQQGNVIFVGVFMEHLLLLDFRA